MFNTLYEFILRWGILEEDQEIWGAEPVNIPCIFPWSIWLSLCSTDFLYGQLITFYAVNMTFYIANKTFNMANWSLFIRSTN